MLMQEKITISSLSHEHLQAAMSIAGAACTMSSQDASMTLSALQLQAAGGCINSSTAHAENRVSHHCCSKELQ